MISVCDKVITNEYPCNVFLKEMAKIFIADHAFSYSSQKESKLARKEKTAQLKQKFGLHHLYLKQQKLLPKNLH